MVRMAAGLVIVATGAFLLFASVFYGNLQIVFFALTGAFTIRYGLIRYLLPSICKKKDLDDKS
jgi:hypothetical protein